LDSNLPVVRYNDFVGSSIVNSCMRVIYRRASVNLSALDRWHGKEVESISRHLELVVDERTDTRGICHVDIGMDIRNVKISVKVPKTSLDSVIRKLQDRNLEFKSYPSYISFVYKYNFIFFKSSKNNTNHVNITKLKLNDDIFKAIRILESILNETVLSHRVDNITATYNFHQFIDLENILSRFSKATYNAERFPGMFIKCDDGNAIIFHSGKTVLLGCKSEKQIWNVINFVRQKVKY